MPRFRYIDMHKEIESNFKISVKTNRGSYFLTVKKKILEVLKFLAKIEVDLSTMEV